MTDRWLCCTSFATTVISCIIRGMTRELRQNDWADDAWVVRASVNGGQVPYARTRRTDVDHPFHAVATHQVDLDDIVQRAHALGVLLDGRAVISHSSAAHLLGFPIPLALQRDPHLHVSVPRPGRAPRSVGVHGHSIEFGTDQAGHRMLVSPSSLEPLPVPILDEPLILVTCARQLQLPALVALADAMLRRAMITQRRDPMLAALRLAPNRPGYHRLTRAAMLRRVGVRSRAETLLRLMIASAGLPEPCVAHPVQSTARSPESWTAEADLAWPSFAVVVEYEGDIHRLSRRRFATDVRRFDRYADEGWRAVRATRDDLFTEPRELMARLERRLRDGGWQPHRRWRPRKVRPAIA